MLAARVAPALVGVTLLVLVGSCEEVLDDFEVGPDLIVEIPENQLALEPTNADPSRCCCRVTGSATNLSEIAVHVDVKFEVFAANDEDRIGAAVDFLPDVQPNETRPISADGLLMPCSDIDRIEIAEVDVRGLWLP